MVKVGLDYLRGAKAFNHFIFNSLLAKLKFDTNFGRYPKLMMPEIDGSCLKSFVGREESVRAISVLAEANPFRGL